MKKLLALLLVSTLVISIMTGCKKDETTDTQGGTEVASDFVDQVVFKVADTEIKLSTVNYFVYQIKNYYESYYGATVWDMPASEEQTVEQFVKEDIQNIAVRLVVSEKVAAERGLTLDDAKKEELMTSAQELFASFTPEVIAKYGFTQEIVNELVLKQGVMELVFEDTTKDFVVDQSVLDEALAADPTYTAIMEAGYDHYYDSVRARHILIKTVDDSYQALPEEQLTAAKAKADDLLARAKAGEDFATLATENTEDPGSVETGGEYTFGRGEMVAEFENAAFNMEVGEISDLVETVYGYHIIKLEENIASTEEQVQQAKDDAAAIVESLTYNQKLADFEIKFAEIEPNYTVEVMEDVWSQITFKDPVAETTGEATTDTSLENIIESVEGATTEEATTEEAATTDTSN
ncbi:MAG: peptidylprolyl isomerase [Vallitaleaceae bacterium]|nr:peptidylprolyl isomerase [Vallitaleaceae bacterium]